ncbi:MFS transporter [Arthrobacter sp. UYEF36]|uniref:MFS transporter n=1 Tax=Arthrobacter sp. UYEF36 TaxID=1756366 RepID=UPI003399A57B
MIVLNVGVIIGTLVLGKLADNWGVKRVLIPKFVISAVSLTLLGFADNMAVLLLLVAITRACTMGAKNMSYAFVPQYYPSFMRSAAIGLASGVGGMGAVVGPTFGGVLLTLRRRDSPETPRPQPTTAGRARRRVALGTTNDGGTHHFGACGRRSSGDQPFRATDGTDMLEG